MTIKLCGESLGNMHTNGSCVTNTWRTSSRDATTIVGGCAAFWYPIQIITGYSITFNAAEGIRTVSRSMRSSVVSVFPMLTPVAPNGLRLFQLFDLLVDLLLETVRPRKKVAKCRFRGNTSELRDGNCILL